MPKLKEKFCISCKETHPISEFNRRKHTNDGYSYVCKKTLLERNKLYDEKKKGGKEGMFNVHEMGF